MVLDFYNLNEQPFGVTPDPRFLYLSPTHREALASVQYGVTAGRGFTALIARPGMGKTTLLFDFLSKVPIPAKTVFLFQSQPTPRDLLRNLLEDLGVQEESDDIGHMQRKLNESLVRESKKGKSVVVVIDEAQNLDESVLEVVRMLSNFETSREKLMHLVLAGQPRLAEMLATSRLEQLRQRVSIIARLQPLNDEEVGQYINHRLSVAGFQSGTALFTKRAQALIVENSGGIPRNINNLCFNAISLGCALKAKRIEADVIREVIKDLELGSYSANPSDDAKVEAKTAVTARTKKISWLDGWRLKVAVPLASLALLGAVAVAWTGLHSARAVDSARVPSQVGMASAPVPATVSLPPLGPINPKLVAETRNVDDGAKAKELPSPASSIDTPTNPIKLEPGGVVVVQPNQTMYRICMQILGRYDDKTKTRIRELNPGLLNLTQLRIGQRIRLPIQEIGRKSVRASVEQERADHAEKP
jgi:type II secretory pathway predicted ATPase ExeA